MLKLNQSIKLKTQNTIYQMYRVVLNYDKLYLLFQYRNNRFNSQEIFRYSNDSTLNI